MKFGFTPEAEILNGRLAMLGFVVAVGTYLTTGQILPGVWWNTNKISNNTHPHSKYEWGTFILNDSSRILFCIDDCNSYYKGSI
jgi:hypothetical protein